MKKLFMFLMLILMPMALIPPSHADWFHNSQSIVTKIDISSDADVVPLAPNGYIQSAVINMTFFPKRTFTQELLKFSTTPQAELIDNNQLKFKWDAPEGRVSFRLSANVKVTNEIPKISEKINFPIENLPAEIYAYTMPSETIDSNDEGIVKTASEIVKGEDDLYAAVFKLAVWTKGSISYNLSTLTADVSQKASWVLKNRYGVCDEITSLFIALLRAVGIPARFASGIAYTDSELFPERWGPHGWAEVYFPGYGWVPFDVTYGEFGWIDPTHIKFKDSLDSDEPSTFYQWLGRNADLRAGKLDIKTELIDKAGYVNVPLDIKASVLKQSVDFGSYNLLEAVVENPNDFYHATELNLNKPKEIKIIGDRLKSLLLLPKEKKRLFWILKLDDNLQSGYSYTFPLSVSTPDNASFEASFIASVRENHASLDDISRTAKLLEEEDTKKYSGNVALECKAEKGEIYEYEDAEVFCTAKNTGNVFIDNAELCFENKCSRISLGISQAKNASFKISTTQIGLRESPVTLRNEIVSKTAIIKLEISDIPKIQIEELDFPLNVSYGDNFTVSFSLAKKSYSSPKDVRVALELNGAEKIWNIDELDGSKRFALKLAGSQLKNGRNSFRLNVEHYDSLKKKYNANKEFSTEMINANPLQVMALSLNELAGISTEATAVMLLSGTIVFILVVLWVFRRGKGVV